MDCIFYGFAMARDGNRHCERRKIQSWQSKKITESVIARSRHDFVAIH